MVYVIVAVFIGIADIWIKNRIEKSSDQDTKELMHGRIKIGKVHNGGMAFQILDNVPFAAKIVSVIVTAFVWLGFLFSLGRKGRTIGKMGLAFMAGGGLGNSFDRIKRGYVVDYINFPGKNKKRKLYFNIADFFIFAGAIMIGISSLKKRR